MNIWYTPQRIPENFKLVRMYCKGKWINCAGHEYVNNFYIDTYWDTSINSWAIDEFDEYRFNDMIEYEFIAWTYLPTFNPENLVK